MTSLDDVAARRDHDASGIHAARLAWFRPGASSGKADVSVASTRGEIHANRSTASGFDARGARGTCRVVAAFALPAAATSAPPGCAEPHEQHLREAARLRDGRGCARAPGGVPADRRRQRRRALSGHARRRNRRDTRRASSTSPRLLEDAGYNVTLDRVRRSQFEFPVDPPPADADDRGARASMPTRQPAPGSGRDRGSRAPSTSTSPATGRTTSGCEGGRLRRLPVGAIALIQRGTCTIRRQGGERPGGRSARRSHHLQPGQYDPIAGRSLRHPSNRLWTFARPSRSWARPSRPA